MTKASMPAIRWATDTPSVGPWNFDAVAPREGTRESGPLAVYDAKERCIMWAHYFEVTDDGGATVCDSGWLSDNPYHIHAQDTFGHVEVTGWIACTG
jgi:hypothetical protein